MSGRNPIGKSDEWYTPARVFGAMAVRFDVDVSAPVDRTHVCTPADHFITADSLSVPWRGFVWMNPPFGGRNQLCPWLDKFLDHGNGVALTPDRTSAPWFQDRVHRVDMLLLTPKIRFVGPDGKQGGSPFDGTALWAVGPRGVQALINAQHAGLGFGVRLDRTFACAA